MAKPSKYNHFFEANCSEYVYNILTTGIIQLDECGIQALIHGDLTKLSQDDEKMLLSEGFLVADDCNEADLFRYYFDRSRFSVAADSLSIVFIPTYNCNLRCPYCYEGNHKCSKRISEKDMDAIVTFAEMKIKESSSATPIKILDIQLYGGEPLLCKHEIYYFCNQMSNLARKYNIKTDYSMVSNLTLLDDEFIEFMKINNVAVQVSIDGNETEHNKKRVGADGKGTYKTIICNLSKLLNAGLKDKITIRLNSDLDNIDELCSDFKMLNQYSNDIYFGVLAKYKGCNDSFNNCIDSMQADILLAKKTDKLYKALGFPIPQRFGKKGPCFLNCENKFMIDCNLDVYKCDLLINHKECRVGYITSDGDFVIESNYYKQMAFSPFNSTKCIECKFLPHCAGGCPATPYLNLERKNGDVSIYDCTFTDEKLTATLKSFVENQ